VAARRRPKSKRQRGEYIAVSPRATSSRARAGVVPGGGLRFSRRGCSPAETTDTSLVAAAPISLAAVMRSSRKLIVWAERSISIEISVFFERFAAPRKFCSATVCPLSLKMKFLASNPTIGLLCLSITWTSTLTTGNLSVMILSIWTKRPEAISSIRVIMVTSPVWKSAANTLLFLSNSAPVILTLDEFPKAPSSRTMADSGSIRRTRFASATRRVPFSRNRRLSGDRRPSRIRIPRYAPFPSKI